MNDERQQSMEQQQHRSREYPGESRMQNGTARDDDSIPDGASWTGRNQRTGHRYRDTERGGKTKNFIGERSLLGANAGIGTTLHNNN
jgi:hypothetical protein